jgi:hypothetical protein
MDHISIPRDPVDYPVTVPHLSLSRANLAYDGLGLLNFPERKGFDPESFAQGSFGKWTPNEATALLQSWCFFGLLAEVFNVISIPVKPEDFVSDDTVTTAPLLDLLREWELRERNLDDEERVLQHRLISDYLECVNHVLLNVAYHRDEADEHEQHFFCKEPPRSCGCITGAHVCPECPASIPEIVLLSVVLLAEYLQRGLDLYDLESPYYAWPESNYLKQRLLRAGWCRQEVAHFHDQHFTLSSLFYLSTITRKSLGFEHAHCNSLRCSREQLDHKTYKTKHSPGCARTSGKRKCTEIVFDPSTDLRISRFVCDHLTPVITVTAVPGRHKFQLTVRAVQRPTLARKAHFLDRMIQRQADFVIGDTETRQTCPLTYVCISHVWSE